jgi:hypothetical protein
MGQPSERKLQLWYEVSRANALQIKVERTQWRQKFFLYLSVIVAIVAVTSVLAR